MFFSERLLKISYFDKMEIFTYWALVLVFIGEQSPFHFFGLDNRLLDLV